MLTVNVDGVPLRYRDVGQGLPILLLHAFPLHGAAFDAQVAALSRRYRFIVPDQRGFGQSGQGEGPSEMSLLARDALALLDALKIDTAVVGGVSMGGYVAMALVVVGEQDAVTPPEKAQQLAGLISGAQLEVIPGAGHLSNQEQPERFNAVLDRFLGALSL